MQLRPVSGQGRWVELSATEASKWVGHVGGVSSSFKQAAFLPRIFSEHLTRLAATLTPIHRSLQIPAVRRTA